jgi:ribosome recycling factor
MSFDEAKTRMEAAVEAVRRDFSTVRTGKATPALLDTVKVDAYGSKMPLNQVASVSTPGPSLLVVQPFDKTLLPDIERAILTSDLGFNPANDGDIIRIPVPPLNEERRKEFAKLLHHMAEDGRVSLRHARKIGNDEVKHAMKEHETSEDEGHHQMDAIQKLTDACSKQVDDMLEKKEKEVLAL